jgi:hypothetical protein
MRTGLAAWPGRRSTVSASRSPPRARPRASREDHDLRRRSPARVPAGCRRSPGEICSRTTNRQIPWQAETLARPEYSSRSGRSDHVLISAMSARPRCSVRWSRRPRSAPFCTAPRVGRASLVAAPIGGSRTAVSSRRCRSRCAAGRLLLVLALASVRADLARHVSARRSSALTMCRQSLNGCDR